MTDNELKIAKHLLEAKGHMKGYNRLMAQATNELRAAQNHQIKAEELKLEGMSFWEGVSHYFKG